MTDFKTNADLLRALHAAAGKKMSPKEVREQKISFVMGVIDESNDITRADVEKIIDEREGCAA